MTRDEEIELGELLGYHAHKYDHAVDHGEYAKAYDGYPPYILHDAECRSVNCDSRLPACHSRGCWHDDEANALDEMPSFSESGEDACIVLERLRAKAIDGTVKISEDGYEVRFHWITDGHGYAYDQVTSGPHATLPEAVARAAILALNAYAQTEWL